MAGWRDERPAHGIIYLKGTFLMCSCGETMAVTGKDKSLSQTIVYDILLDRHAAHKAKREKKG